MKRWLPVIATVAVLAGGTGGASLFLASAPATPNRLTCEGYAEKRVFLENQSWVEPQTGPATHPGTGQQGHIHVSTCFPLYQTVTSPTLVLDIRLQLHNVPGKVNPNFNVELYQMGGPTGGTMRRFIPSGGDCAVADCDRWLHIDFPLSEATESGWVEFEMWQIVEMRNPDGTKTGQSWYNLTRWFFNLQNGKPPRTDVFGIPETPVVWTGGDTWLEQMTPNTGTKYSHARIHDGSFPWDYDTGQPIPVSGLWRPVVWFNGDEGQVLIDPALHANPPNFGTEIWKGVPTHNPATGAKPRGMFIDVDTTQFTNGPHRMLLISCDIRTNGQDNCGVLVVPFIVDNVIPPDIVLDPGQTYIVDCPTELSGSVDSARAVLTCGA